MIDPTRRTLNAGRVQTGAAYTAGFLAISAFIFPRQAAGLFYRADRVTRVVIESLF